MKLRSVKVTSLRLRPTHRTVRRRVPTVRRRVTTQAILTDGATYPHQVQYDSQGRKVSSSTTRDNRATWDTTLWQYDSATGYKTSKTYANGSQIHYTYTHDGKPLRTTWARGELKENAYDENHRLTSTTFSSTSTVARTYASAGQLETIVDSQGIEHTYNHNTRLLVTNETVSLNNKEFNVARTYDNREREETTKVDFANKVYSLRTRGYDNESRLSNLTFRNSNNRVASVSHSYSGSYLTGYEITLPNGRVFSRELTRDTIFRDLIKRQDYNFNGASIYWANYHYDGLNRLTNTVDSISLIRAYGYNARSEVISALIGTNDYSYAFDTIGNRTQSSITNNVMLYLANNLNQYTQVNTNAFVYDLDGNLIDDTQLVYEYDCENRLISAAPKYPITGSKRIINRYDYQHRRVQKIVEQYADVEWIFFKKHTFVYDDWNLLLELVENADSTTQTIEYFWGNDLSGSEQGAGGIGGLLALSIDGDYYLPIYDHNGNILSYIDVNGSTVATYTYDAFGNTIAQTGTLATTFNHRFSTKYHDKETRFYYYGYRFYSPALGRWLNRDPIEEEGGAHLYAFVYNAPLLAIDSYGCRVYVKGSLDPNIPADVGAGLWNSENRGFSDYLQFGTIRLGINTLPIKLAYPDASAMLDYYFSRRGGIYQINLNKLIAEVRSARELLANEAFEAIKFTEGLENGEHKITSRFASSGYIAGSENKNWYYAIGGYSAWGKGRAKVCGDSFTLQYEYRLLDYYNWDIGKSINFYGVEITDEYMGSFHRKGMAKEFKTEGSLHRTLKWRRGEVLSPHNLFNLFN